MNESKISVRYARALYLSAGEHQCVDSVKNDMMLISEVTGESEKFRQILGSPVTKPSQKRAWFSQLFQGRVDQLTMNFLNLLVKNNRLQHLPQITRVFMDIWRNTEGIKWGVLTTAFPVNDELKNKILAVLTDVYQLKIDLQTQQNPELIGGFILRVGDQQYDASVAMGLKKLHQALRTKNI